MTTILFDFEGEWYQVPGQGIWPEGWHPYGDPTRTCEGGFPAENDVHFEYLVKEGQRSLGYEKVWDTHDGGALTGVPTDPGDDVRFWMHGRYIFQSDDAGVDVSPIHMRIGIDLERGVDPNAASVVWSPEQEIAVRNFDGPIEWFLFEISAKVYGSRATLFLYTNPAGRGARHSGPVWDDGGVEITPGNSNGDGECRGLPRIDYKRTVNVTPDKAKAREILEKTWPQTVSNSYDDAGIGDLTRRIPVLWDIPKSDEQEFLDWYAQWYPGTKVIFKYTDDWSEPSEWEDFLLAQGDPRWGDIVFGPGNCTIRNSGCFISDVAMAQRIYGIDSGATPATVNEALGPDGYAPDCLAEWIDIKNSLGLTISSSTKAQADAHINGGGVMLIEVLPKELQHFVLAVEVLGDDNYLVLDPWKNVVAPLLDLYSGWESWRMVTKTGTVPEPPGPAPGPGPQLPERDSLIGLHLQTGMEGDMAYVRQMGRGIVKAFSFEGAAQMKAINPDVTTVVRMYTREQHIGGDPARAAAKEIARFHDALIKHHTTTDYVESWNEMYSSSDREANRWQVEFDKHFAYQIAALPVDTRACTIVAAVGNPLEDWVVDLLPAVRAIYETGGAIGYHPYWWGNPAADVLHEMRSWWPWHAGRWQEWDKVFVAHGLYPKYALGETGVVGSSDGYSLNAHAGWKSSHTLKNDWGRYFAQISQFEGLLKKWNATHGNRCLGAVLFTTGADFTNWLNFQIRKLEMESLATL